jgi:hypothetical protein
MRLASFLCWHVAEAQTAEAEASAALELFGTAGDEAGRRAALNEWGWIRGSTIGLHAQAQRARQALSLARAAGDATLVQHALGSLGHAVGTTGEFEEGLALLREGLDMAVASGDRTQVEWFSAVKWSFCSKRRILQLMHDSISRLTCGFMKSAVPTTAESIDKSAL